MKYKIKYRNIGQSLKKLMVQGNTFYFALISEQTAKLKSEIDQLKLQSTGIVWKSSWL